MDKRIAILRTNEYKDPYQLVEVVQNPVSAKNKLAIVKINGELKMTGGILIDYHPTTEKILKKMTGKEQWDWLCSIISPKCKFVKGNFDYDLDS